MDGMVLAAGLGTRLRPITDHLPKALVEVDGVPQLDRTLTRLSDAGCDRIVVNVHHHASLIDRHLAETCPNHPEASGSIAAPYAWNEAEVVVSHEAERPLDTGGGIRQASEFFRGDRTILVHNVDVISTVDLGRLALAHETGGAIATLVVQRRQASRYLVFDASGLCGRIDVESGREEWAREPAAPMWKAGFTGIQALRPDLPGKLIEDGAFSITGSYLRLASAGERILPFDATGDLWLDIGSPQRLRAARKRLQEKDEDSSRSF
jgi:NDP-sugar pyrophosphorylase family protein